MKAAALLCAAAALSGCATLSDKECRRADWRAIGQSDGVAGWGISRLDEHAKACREVGVVPDPTAYARGREQGLQSYCQPQVGRTKGADGASYYGVCSGPAEAAFMRGYQVGKQIHDLKKLQDSNRRQRKELTDQLAKKDIKEDESKRIRRDLERLDHDDRRLQRLVEQAYQIPL
ncbi:DUF2799 domain-containing protein [Aquincola sp. S2]|uniref:DUF2799 domain-containing protein n=1 Tax=Pseudaquabacterium terrae TaxID=2732868 RepID=A0ABX2ESW4_9BURK|nr:DUF2799 domain-containing protein [Aquabacterium terrae]NRF71576.1 DUF2799 domain-containing protein [Aquabacterium terrae]